MSRFVVSARKIQVTPGPWSRIPWQLLAQISISNLVHPLSPPSPEIPSQSRTTLTYSPALLSSSSASSEAYGLFVRTTPRRWPTPIVPPPAAGVDDNEEIDAPGALTRWGGPMAPKGFQTAWRIVCQPTKSSSIQNNQLRENRKKGAKEREAWRIPASQPAKEIRNPHTRTAPRTHGRMRARAQPAPDRCRRRGLLPPRDHAGRLGRGRRRHGRTPARLGRDAAAAIAAVPAAAAAQDIGGARQAGYRDGGDRMTTIATTTTDTDTAAAVVAQLRCRL
jgi:hypothetical protein